VPAVRVALRIAAAVVGAGLIYLGVTLAQVWWASGHDDARPAQAIVVLGAAQYNGRPSPDLRARLDHAVDLYRRHLAPVVVVTGGSQPGDKYTEATASANYLLAHDIPDADILREVSGRTTWESLAAASRFLRERGITRVLLVSDPFHSERVVAIADELGLRGYASPTHTSPIRGLAVWPYFARETVAVAAGRIVGFRRLVGIEHKAMPCAAPGQGLVPCAAAHSGVV
jgi:uncharacterized SAM-binding protein YcdF (DUF218 family)